MLSLLPDVEIAASSGKGLQKMPRRNRSAVCILYSAGAIGFIAVESEKFP